MIRMFGEYRAYEVETVHQDGKKTVYFEPAGRLDKKNMQASLRKGMLELAACTESPSSNGFCNPWVSVSNKGLVWVRRSRGVTWKKNDLRGGVKRFTIVNEKSQSPAGRAKTDRPVSPASGA